MPTEPRALQQSKQCPFPVVRQPAAQQWGELRDRLGGHPLICADVEIPCRPGAFVGGLDNAGAESLRPRVQVFDVGMWAFLVLSDLRKYVTGYRGDRRDEHILD